MSERRIAALLFALGLLARLGIALWAGSHFPPAGDASFYDTFARRLAAGEGYTWVWDDGAITYAAHYPVGYPAMLAVPYRIFGSSVVVAGIFNALVGALAVLGVYQLAGRDRRAIIAATITALHPALVLYTPAVMTEGIATSLVVCAAAIASLDRFRPFVRIALAALLLGVATLVRPQSLLFAPILGICVMKDWRSRAIGAGVALLVTIAVCAPWTARNCVRMNRCALVSVNAGWNLLIGTQTESGGWQKVDVPAPCRTVWDEAEKDACFERAAKAAILAHPIDWVRRVPAKLRTTLDYFGAGPWYLHASNASRFSDRAKLVWGGAETIVSRLLLLAGLVSRFLSLHRDKRRILQVAAGAGALLALTEHWGWLAYLVLALVVLAMRPKALPDAFSALVILSTAVVHAAFFGAGRYGLIVVPFVAILALRQDHRASIVT